MFKKGDYIVFRNDVCMIKDVKKNGYMGNDYYVLGPISDISLTIEVPTKSESVREIISKREVEKIITSIPDIGLIEAVNDKMMEQEYKKLLNTGLHSDLIKIIKTTYTRNKNRELNNKKIGEKDDAYFKKAEKLLYNEFSIALGKTYEQTKKYVVEEVIKRT